MLKVATASTQPWRDIREQKLSYRGWQGQDRTVGTWCHYASDEIKPGTVLLPNLCEIIDSPVSKFLLLFNEMVHISSVQFSSVQSLTHVWLFATPWIAAHQASLSITNSWNSLRLMSIHRISDAIQPFHPLSSPSPPAPNPSQHQSLFQWVNPLYEVAKVLEFQLQHHSLQRSPKADLLQNGLVGSPCSPRDSQESSPTPELKSINSSVLSLLHSPTLTSIHDHRKNHSLD